MFARNAAPFRASISRFGFGFGFGFGRQLCGVLAGLAMLWAAAAAATADDLCWRPSSSAAAPIAWENVEGPPLWVCGARPVPARGVDYHVVHLQPGTQVVFKVPPRAMIRVVQPGRKAFAAGAIELWTSTGSGLFVRQVTASSLCGDSWIAVPDHEHTSLARVTRPAHHACEITVGLFTSRWLPPPQAPPPLTYLEGCCPKVTLCGPGKSERSEHLGLAAGQQHTFAVQGPGRLSIETRLRYPPTEARRFQAYRLAVSLGDQVVRLFELETTAESSGQVLVDQREAVVGRQERVEIDIPAGTHRLGLLTTAPVYARIAVARPADYVFPGLNQPLRSASDRAEPPSRMSLWEMSAADAADLARAGPLAAAADQRQIALRSARDNAYRQGGLQAAMFLRAAAVGRPEDLPLRRAADKLVRFHTFYRNLVPARRARPDVQNLAWFYLRRMPDPGALPSAAVVAEQHVDDALRLLGHALFTTVPATEAEASLYRIPPDCTPSILRVLVDRGSLRQSARIAVQYENRLPMVLEAVPDTTATDAAGLPSQAEAALTALGVIHSGIDGGTLGGPFSRGRTPARLAPVAAAELVLPPGVGQVRVWQLSAGAGPVRAALQYRAAKPYQLSEAGFLAAQGGGADAKQALVDALRDESPRGGLSLSTSELRNHWLPLVRHLRAQRDDFVASVDPLPRRRYVRSVSAASRTWSWRQRAIELASRGDDLAALEIWSRYITASAGDDRRQALLARARTLGRLGETFLMQNELRALFLQDGDSVLQDQALAELRRCDLQGNKPRELEQLEATAVLRQTSAARLDHLAEALLWNERYDFAFMAALATPPGDRSGDALARCAFHLGWWTVFDQAVAAMTAADERQFWLGQQALRRGRHEEACGHFRQAGAAGRAYADHWRQGVEILRQLESPDLDRRVHALFAWESWQQSHPGPWRWQEDQAVVVDYPGAESIYSVGGDTFAQFYRAHPAAPLRLKVHGPAQISLEVRPLHPAGSHQPVNDWLFVRDAGQLFWFGVNGNRPAPGLTIVGDSQETPGTKLEPRLRLGSGLHTLTVVPEHTNVLVRVFVRRPELPLPVLPPVNRDTVAAVVSGQYGRTTYAGGRFGQDAVMRLLPADKRRQSTELPIVRQPAIDDSRLPAAVEALDPVTAGRLALRLDLPVAPFAAELESWALDPAGGFGSEKILALARLNRLPARIDQCIAAYPVPGPVQQAMYLSQDCVEAALAVPADSAEALRARMAILVRKVEQNTADPDRYRCLAEALFHEHPTVTELRQLRSRISRTASWKLFEDIEASAGLHARAVDRWSPEAPGLRVRRSLLDELAAGENILSGQQTLVVDLDNPQPAELDLAFALASAGHLPPAVMTVVVRLDDQAPQRVPLAAAASRNGMTLQVPGGPHQLRLALERPLANQYVRVVVRQRVDQAESSAGPQFATIESRLERFYHVATRAEPVRFAISGPAWVRIDQLHGEHTVSRFVAVLEHSRPFVLTPAAGETARLVRVFTLVRDPEKVNVPAQWIGVATAGVPPPLLQVSFPNNRWPGADQPDHWFVPAADPTRPLLPSLALVPPDAAPLAVPLEDAYPLGRQEDGTWGFGLGAFQRRALEEDATILRPDTFLESRATHQFFDQWRRSYQQTDFLVRAREQSGPSFSIRHQHWWQEPHGLPWRASIDAAAYVQHPSDPLPADVSRTESAVFLRGRIYERYDLDVNTYHLPAISIFGRLLSMDRRRYAPGRVDQDIFTRYKSDHRDGITISDTFVYQPWLDAKWWLRPAVVTNEDLNLFQPDHVSLRVGWSQAFRAVELDASYRLTRFAADNDRRRALIQNLLYLDTSADLDLASPQRLQVVMRVGHDLGKGSTSAYLLLSWYIDNGRRFRDAPPGEKLFPLLRELRPM